MASTTTTTPKLTGKVAIITGASKGIGAGIARALAADGAAVIINYNSDKRGAQTVADEIVAHGGKALAVAADISKKPQAQALIDAAIARHGRLDILVNNSGVYEFAPILEFTEDQFHRMYNTNVLGLLFTTQAAVKHMREGASIINIGSVVTSAATPGASVYAGTKGAVDVITRVLANELGPRKIRVNALNPGMVETEGTITGGFIDSDFAKQVLADTPLGRIGQPKDIAAIAAFLASDDASWLTGELIFAGGGLR